MKKLMMFLSLCGLVLSLIGCGKEIERSYKINYRYLNDSSSEITIHSFTPNSFGGVVDSLFVIPVNGTHVISFTGEYYSRPLKWQYLSTGGDYTTISNGEKVVTQTLANRDALYVLDNYTVVSEKNRVKTVLYIFDDEFFENGEPIE